MYDASFMPLEICRTWVGQIPDGMSLARFAFCRKRKLIIATRMNPVQIMKAPFRMRNIFTRYEEG